jgi:tetratricopeptide (TPR) repeat protein
MFRLISLVILALTAAPALAQSCADRIADYERRIDICAAEAASAPDPAAAAEALGYQGEAERLLGRLDEAAATLRQAIALAPANAWYWTELGTVAMDGGDAVGAVAQYSTALELAPDDGYTRRNRADAWRILNAPGRCVADAEAAIAVDPGDLFARLVGARCLTGLGRAEAALAELDQVLAADPAWIEAHLARVVALMALGKHAEAVEAADQALALDPVALSPEMAEELRALRLAARARIVPVDQLLAEAELLAKDYPDNAQVTNVTVWALLSAGRVAEAETEAVPLRALVGTEAMEGVFHDTLAQLDLAQGRLDQALAGFATALRMEPSLARIYSGKLSAQGFLPLSNAPDRVMVALRRCIEERAGACRVGS